MLKTLALVLVSEENMITLIEGHLHKELDLPLYLILLWTIYDQEKNLKYKGTFLRFHF